MKAFAVLAGTVAALAVWAAPAAALPILAPEDATELAALLADATEQQGGICYGWEVQVDDASGRFTGSDVGSNLGVGSSARSCDRYVVFGAVITYTSELSEQSDSATLAVLTSFSHGTFTKDDLARVGVTSGSLLSENDDLAIINATLSLPLLVAERGFAPPVKAEPDAQQVAAGDRVQGSHGSDWVRKYGSALLLGGLFLVIGLIWLVVARFQEPITAAAWQLTKGD